MSVPDRWKPIAGWEGFYSVSDLGHVRNDRTGYVLAAPPIRMGYPAVTLSRPKERSIRSVHQLVADAFNRGSGPVVRHLDGNPLNNRAENLLRGSVTQNARDAVHHGTHRNTAKTHCIRGHSLQLAYLDNLGRRVCQECKQQLAQERINSGSAPHGEVRTYTYGCRCDRCRARYSEHQRSARANRKQDHA